MVGDYLLSSAIDLSKSLYSRFASFQSYQPEDLASFSLLTGQRRSFAKGDQLRLEGAPNPEVYRLESGWLACSVNTPDGGRQITKIHLPGDLVGLPSMASTMSMETIEALTAAEVEVIPLEAFGRILKTLPKLSAMLLLWAQEERVSLMHQLAMIGRKQGTRRLAAFLLAIYRRVLLGDPDVGLNFPLPLTQQDLADATGMTSVHVNRCLKSLREEGVLTVLSARVIIYDLEKLERWAGIPALPKRTLGWA